MVAILITALLSTSMPARESTDKTQIPWTAQRTTCTGTSAESIKKQACRATASSAAHLKSSRRCAPPRQILQRSGETVQEGRRRADPAREEPQMRQHHALDGLRRSSGAKSSPRARARPQRGPRAQRACLHGVYLFLRQFLAVCWRPGEPELNMGRGGESP